MLYASILNKPKKMFFINNENSKIYVDKAIKQIEGTPTHRLHLKYLFIVLRFKISILNIKVNRSTPLKFG